MKKIIGLLTLLLLINSAYSASALSNETSLEATTCSKFTENISIKDNLFKNKRLQIKQIQETLVNAGYLKATPNGYFGPLTLKAVKAYQKDNGISQTGFVGEKTRAMLRSKHCNIEENYICDYAAPPEGCNYIPGAHYNQKTQCGMILKCDDLSQKPVSPNCKVWNDGCNTCSKSSIKGYEMCTLRACSQDTVVKPYCMAYFDDHISDTCKSWNDGCNSCTRNEIGGLSACTKIACYQQGEAYCKEYFSIEKSCLDNGRAYKEGESSDCLTVNGQRACIADATHVCRNGTWKIEGGLPIRTSL